tara:strand:+ start:133 stop:336 length:204 start_codon:yes stop_codon:yes gene_type:complete
VFKLIPKKALTSFIYSAGISVKKTYDKKKKKTGIKSRNAFKIILKKTRNMLCVSSYNVIIRWNNNTI